MIKYDNQQVYRILFRNNGSVILRVVPVACVSGVLGLVLAILRRLGKVDDWFPEKDGSYFAFHQFGSHIVVMSAGYLLVVRTNLALARWMEAITHVQTLMAKWVEAYKEINAFFAGKEDTSDRVERILMFRVRIGHWFSLMIALAFATLRGGEIETLEDVGIKEIFPKHISSKQKRHTFASGRRSVVKCQSASSSFSKCGEQSPSSPATPSGQSSPAMRSYQTVDSIISRATLREAGITNSTLDLGNSQVAKTELMREMDLVVLSRPSLEEIDRLEEAEDKVNLVLLWILQGLVLECRVGTLDTPPPILTRVFQELSDGMLGFNQAHKIAATPFPFPFAQMASIILCILDILLPFAIDNFTKNVVLTPTLCFILPICYHGLNATAVELEEPFGIDWNDIDLELNNRKILRTLIDVLRLPNRPPYAKHWPEPGSGQFEEQVRKKITRGLNNCINEHSKHLPWDVLRFRGMVTSSDSLLDDPLLCSSQSLLDIPAKTPAAPQAPRPDSIPNLNLSTIIGNGAVASRTSSRAVSSESVVVAKTSTRMLSGTYDSRMMSRGTWEEESNYEEHDEMRGVSHLNDVLLSERRLLPASDCCVRTGATTVTEHVQPRSYSAGEIQLREKTPLRLL